MSGVDRRAFLAGIPLSYAAAAAAAAEPGTPPPPRDPFAQAATGAGQAFPLGAVALLDGPLLRQRDKNREWLIKLDPDRLLSAFRLNAGLDPKAPPYRGWESEPRALWGHILGFYLSGVGYMVQATGDAELTRRLDYITDQLHAVQEAQKSGILIAVPDGKKLFQEIAAGRFEITNATFNYGYEINNVFEPTYTWNKITLGLYQAYKATGNDLTRRVLIRTADWFGNDVLDHLSTEQIQKLLFCEHGSIHESMLLVYQLTGNRKYFRWAKALCFDRIIDPLAAGDGAFLTDHHANCSIPVYTGAERIHQHADDPRLHKAAVNFLNEVIDHRSWVIGGNSANERFFPPADFEKAIHVRAGPETCNSVNMLRLIEAVYERDPQPKYMDNYERILWNHLLAVHEPERGMVNYYVPQRPGTYRIYSDEYDSMWCCVGTGLESPGKYGQMIYTHGAGRDALDVNLFVSSRLRWPEAGLTLQQDTTFPDAGRAKLTFAEAPTGAFSLRIRHPWWVPASKLSLTLNGRVVPSESAPGGYAIVTRHWRAGDRIEAELPMALSVVPLPHSTRYAAILYGPIVLSGELGREGVTKQNFWGLRGTIPEVVLPETQFPAIKVPIDQLVRHIRPARDGPLTFRMSGATTVADEVTLVPFFRNHFQRYAIYWPIA